KDNEGSSSREREPDLWAPSRDCPQYTMRLAQSPWLRSWLHYWRASRRFWRDRAPCRYADRPVPKNSENNAWHNLPETGDPRVLKWPEPPERPETPRPHSARARLRRQLKAETRGARIEDPFLSRGSIIYVGRGSKYSQAVRR